MMNSNHTPEPWTFRFHEGSAFCEVFDVTGTRVCSTPDLRPIEENRANIRLIAAAPKILRMLAMAESLIASDIIRDDARCLEQIRAVIAEATGKAA
jgi:hypothetical protein